MPFFFQRTRSIGLCKNMKVSMLDRFDNARFIESAWLLNPKAFTHGNIDPYYNLVVMCS